LLGEGIIPATWCAELFVQHLYDTKSYREAVLNKFKIYALVFKFIKMKIARKFNMVRHIYDLLLIYNHMKTEEDRYGMQVKLTDMLKIARI
jgi:hypothetical protein